ncbi:MAG TPA: 16S rRNA (cytosine(967)-C(5))-methyltransferase RsmB [Gemmatimonadales bacterium]|nr:16S rRNA (cytosine(967)-C(5))-methyltransferase RsmB [Gemmatimonadales bacterium]
MMRSSGLPPRRAALRVLSQVRQGRPFDAALDRAVNTLSAPDRRLAHELAAGVLRRRSALDAQLAPLVTRAWDGVVPDLQDILRLGAYQLTALQRVPPHAAVDTSVALAKKIAGARGASFVNAVLRRLAQTAQAETLHGNATTGELAARHSHPEWLVARWIEAFGEQQTEDLLRWNNSRPKLVAQSARLELDRLADLWRAAGVEFVLAPHGAGLVAKSSRPTELPGYVEGYFIVQDPAQALLARFVAPPPGSTIYDACAAPGGKTIALGRSARVLAGEINRHRARRLATNVARAGQGREHVVVADARKPPVRSVDIVLLDVPCLGTGTFARHPDARWRVAPDALDHITELQRTLLESTAPIVAGGGLLIYSTCSLEREENHVQVERFLQRHPEFHREPAGGVPESMMSADGDLVILPQTHAMDGAYAARLRRSA